MGVYDITDLRRFQAEPDDPELYHSAFESTTGTIVEHYLLANLEEELPGGPTVSDLAIRLNDIDNAIQNHPIAQMTIDLAALPRLTTTRIFRPEDADYPDTLTPLLDAHYRTRTWEETPIITSNFPPVEHHPFLTELYAERSMIQSVREHLPSGAVRLRANDKTSAVNSWMSNRLIRKACAWWVVRNIVVRRELAALHLPLGTLTVVEGLDKLPGGALKMTTMTSDGITKQYRKAPTDIIGSESTGR